MPLRWILFVPLVFYLLAAQADETFFYAKALQALADCRVEKAREFASRLQAGQRLSDLQRRIKQQQARRDRVDRLYARARKAFSQCDYATAAEQLERAIYAPGCRRIRQQLADKLLTILTAARDDAGIERQWGELAAAMQESGDNVSVDLLKQRLDTLAGLRGKAVCADLDQRLSGFLQTQEQRYTRLEFANRPYAAVSRALEKCDVSQAIELIKALPQGRRRQQFQARVDELQTLQNETRETLAQVQADYTRCRYDSAVQRLEELRSKQHCSDTIADLDVRIARARADYEQDQKVQRLMTTARTQSSPQASYASLVKARQLNRCEQRQPALEKLAAAKRQQLPPQQQVAAMDCSAWSHGEAYWIDSAQRAGCRCAAGYRPNEQKTGCVATAATQVSSLDCSTWENAEPRWFAQAREAGCFCKNGYRWKPDYTACEPVSGQQ